MAETLRFADCCRRARLRALATVLGEETNKAVHRLEPRRIDHAAAVAAYRDQSREAEPVEVKGQRVRCEAEPFGDLTGRHAFRAGLDQQPEDIQTVLLGQ